ncbi:nucleotide-diphospho-sugar transferase [Podospora appendiculata]|uniref:Nucleotide-diphospho-sugar transferase n=1 Tax=Podospora appendiculata TaxID=314037 RepID=A0AAE0X704_9PEZI|nr:nucleotide-diphospho-sugar transferase [Podospora appendiculata]
MRLRPLTVPLLSIFALAVVVVIASRIVLFVHIFFEHAGPALTQEEIETAYNNATAAGEKRQQHIPKIIHQIFHNWKDPTNETLPSDWDATRDTCLQANPDFEHRLWTDRTSTEFITAEYPWFLSTYQGYAYPVQRVDALRYFLMRHYGGIYVDLDNGCSRSLTPLLYYPAWVTDGGHGALSNNILGARPNHPYWILVTESLIPWGYKYPFPYFTVSYASGQWFETALWERYHRMLLSQKPAARNNADKLYRVMMDMRAGAARWVFFTQGRGGSWDQWDNHFFGYIGNILVPRIRRNAGYIFLGAAVLVGVCVWGRRRFGSCCCCLWCLGGKRRKGYKVLPAGPAQGVSEEHEMV